MALQHYHHIATSWNPGSSINRTFLGALGGGILAIVVLSVIIASIDVPEKPRQETKKVVPERIANFIKEKKKENPTPKPTPKIVETPKPIPTSVPTPIATPKVKPSPKVKRTPKPRATPKPVSEAERKKREAAK